MSLSELLAEHRKKAEASLANLEAMYVYLDSQPDRIWNPGLVKEQMQSLRNELALIAVAEAAESVNEALIGADERALQLWIAEVANKRRVLDDALAALEQVMSR